MNSKLSLCLILALLCGCHSKPKPPPSLTEMMGQAHGLDTWAKQTALAGDVHVELAGDGVLDARFIHDIKTGKTRMQLADDSILVFDGQRVWVWPATAPVKNARAILRTWPLLVMLPFRVQDKQAVWGPTENVELAAQILPAATVKLPAYLTDASDQWFKVFADPKNHRLQAVVYPLKNDDQVRQAISFYGYHDVEGMIFPTDWRFWQWNAAVGIHGRPIGTARIYNLELFVPKATAFVPPAGARQETGATTRP